MKGSLHSTMDSDESTIIMGAEVLSDRGESPPPPPKSPVPPTTAEKIAALVAKAKFYTSLCLGTSAILAVFAFLFLIPFVVEPAINTILADFESEPVTCAVSEHLYVEGMKNCSWASCREGCTTSHTRCFQVSTASWYICGDVFWVVHISLMMDAATRSETSILVNYSRLPYAEFLQSGLTAAGVQWDVADTRYLINTEGCGYPPRVNCSSFARALRELHDGAAAFPCYYSRAHPERVVERYSWPATLQHLALALAAPPLVFAVAVGVLAYWHCACAGRAPDRFPPAKEDKLLCDELDLDEPEESLYIRGRTGSRDTDALWKG